MRAGGPAFKNTYVYNEPTKKTEQKLRHDTSRLKTTRESASVQRTTTALAAYSVVFGPSSKRFPSSAAVLSPATTGGYVRRAGAGGRRRAFATACDTNMSERNNETTEKDAQLLDLQPAGQSYDSPHFAEAFDAFDGSIFQVSNEKSQDGRGELTRLTDLTANKMGVYVASARLHPHSRPLGLLATPSTTAVKSVKSVKPQDGEGWISPPCRQTGCQFDGNAGPGVVA